MLKNFNPAFMNMEFMLDSMFLGHLACPDIADADLYYYVMWGEI